MSTECRAKLHNWIQDKSEKLAELGTETVTSDTSHSVEAKETHLNISVKILWC